MQIKFEKREIKELLKAWIAISLAFGILLSPSLMTNFERINGFLIAFGISLFTVGLGFVIHELAHKIVAQKYYCIAEFKANNSMLILAIAMSFLGFILAAPGAVEVKGGVNKKQIGKISFAGPFSNFLLAITFVTGIFFTTGLLQYFFFQGFFINSWLGFFNMIPFLPFDGIKIYKWNKIAYISLTGALLIMVILSLGI